MALPRRLRAVASLRSARVSHGGGGRAGPGPLLPGGARPSRPALGGDAAAAVGTEGCELRPLRRGQRGVRRALAPAAPRTYPPGPAARAGEAGEGGWAAGGTASARPFLTLPVSPARAPRPFSLESGGSPGGGDTASGGAGVGAPPASSSLHSPGCPLRCRGGWSWHCLPHSSG